jgi:hypothetical protein
MSGENDTRPFDAAEHARKRRDELRRAEKEAFASLVIEAIDHPAVRDRLRKFITDNIINDGQGTER